MNSAQKSWSPTTITSGSGTDSVSWSIHWGSDSLIKGENFVLGMAVESDAATTNNLGVGTPFAGNIFVYPVYRIDPVAAPVKMTGKKPGDAGKIRLIRNPFFRYAVIPGHRDEMFTVYNCAGKLMGTYYGNRIGEGLSVGIYYLKPKATSGLTLRIEKLN